MLDAGIIAIIVSISGAVVSGIITLLSHIKKLHTCCCDCEKDDENNEPTHQLYN